MTSDLRRLLTPPDGCSAPCFLGIQPGITTLEEAMTVLKLHDWVGEVDPLDPPYVSWSWSGRQPGIVPGTSKGILSFSLDRQQVVAIAVQTSLPVAAMYLFGGGPIIENSKSLKRGQVYATVIYPEYSIMTFTTIACPATARLFWESPLGIEFFQIEDNFRTGNGKSPSIDLFC